MITKEDWNRIVDQSNFPYYTMNFEWFSAIEKTYPNFEKHVLINENSLFPFIIDKEKKIIASPSPFGGVGGPTDFKFLEDNLKEIERISSIKKIKYIVLYFATLGKEYIEILNKRKYLIQKQTYLMVNTERQINEILNSIHKSKRRYIKKIENEFIFKTINYPSTKEIEEFYNLYIEVMVKNNCSNIFSLDHFKNITEYLKENVILDFIFDTNKNLLGCSFLINSKNIITTYFDVVSPKYYKTQAATFLFWNQIKRCVHENKKYADLGPSVHESSNFIFKTYFGAEVLEFIMAFKYTNIIDSFFKTSFKKWVKSF